MTGVRFSAVTLSRHRVQTGYYSVDTGDETVGAWSWSL